MAYEHADAQTLAFARRLKPLVLDDWRAHRQRTGTAPIAVVFDRAVPNAMMATWRTVMEVIHSAASSRA